MMNPRTRIALFYTVIVVISLICDIAAILLNRPWHLLVGTTCLLIIAAIAVWAAQKSNT